MGSLYGRKVYGRGLYSRLLDFIRLLDPGVRAFLRVVSTRALTAYESTRIVQKALSARATGQDEQVNFTAKSAKARITGKTP